jgi:hypothetical protein
VVSPIERRLAGLSPQSLFLCGPIVVLVASFSKRLHRPGPIFLNYGKMLGNASIRAAVA